LRLGLPDKGIACGEIGPLGLARTKPLMARAIRSKRPERGS